MEEIKKILKSNFPLIAFLTSIGYLMSYFYQLSIANYYGYPEEYISFDLDALLRTFALFFTIALIIIAPLSLISTKNNKGWLALIFLLFLFFIYLAVFSPVNPLTFFVGGKAISLPVIIAYAIVPVATFYTLLTYINGARYPKLSVFSIMLLAFSIYTGPNLVGTFSSYAKLKYFHLDKESQYVLLSSSGSRMIFGACDTKGVRFLLKESSTVGELIPFNTQNEGVKIRDCFFNRDFK
ncbi:TPA: hypothetical protein ACK1V4_002489 [Klebsiella aerogenes]|uniref:hypothetical protein n=1 Tax=Klebsiella aerogenes TaxID=548 RepID=UPI000B41C6D3|nr:hypothetical protein [Klebsiella aerogenes]EKU0354048.1 hypothetical protein [Klebsiella aerogenes]MBK0634522.1 hypothetical protein [Klebsiella aerogenes]RNT11866.1 hypothetical protein B9Z99_018860 [Klebsiella aerogenes]HBQ7831044.1 hypothetical protein [Klebsiella aerogenes]HBS5779177.1 hypothetical protein [Klebsiella aerogenes]